MYRIPVFLIFCFLIACNPLHTRSRKVFINDRDYFEIKRKYSPDKTKFLLTYGIDQGATGSGEVGTAVLNINDTSVNIQPFTVAWHEYNSNEWVDNNRAIFYLDYLRKMRGGRFIKPFYDTVINGVKISYGYKDLIDSSHKMVVLQNILSPDSKYRLSVYRYVRDSSENDFLNISVTKTSDTIPRYGNFFISDFKHDYIYYSKWSNSNELMLYTIPDGKYIIENYVVESRLKLPIKIKERDDVPIPFRWSEQNDY